MDDATKAKLEALGSILVDCKPHPEEWDGNTAAEWGADTLIAVCRVLGVTPDLPENPEGGAE